MRSFVFRKFLTTRRCIRCARHRRIGISEILVIIGVEIALAGVSAGATLIITGATRVIVPGAVVPGVTILFFIGAAGIAGGVRTAAGAAGIAGGVRTAAGAASVI